MKIKRLKIPFDELSERNKKIIRKLMVNRDTRDVTTALIGSGGPLLGRIKPFVIPLAALWGLGFFYGSKESSWVRKRIKLIARNAAREKLLKENSSYALSEIKKNYAHVYVDGKGNLVFVREPAKGFGKAVNFLSRPFKRRRAKIKEKKLKLVKIA